MEMVGNCGFWSIDNVKTKTKAKSREVYVEMKRLTVVPMPFKATSVNLPSLLLALPTFGYSRLTIVAVTRRKQMQSLAHDWLCFRQGALSMYRSS